MLVVQEGHTYGHGITQRAAHGAFNTFLIGIGRSIKNAVGYIQITFDPLQGRLVTDVMDQATGCITAVQGSLWAFQYLYALNIEERERLCLGNSNIAFVEVDGGRRLDDVVKVVLGYATNGKLRVLACYVSTDMDAGCKCSDIKTVLYTQCPHLITGKGGNGNTNVLHALFTFLGSDGDFFQDILCAHRKWHTKKQKAEYE